MTRITTVEVVAARAIVETIFPGCQSVDLSRFERFLSQTLESVPASSALALRAAILAATVAPVAVLRRPVLLWQLSESERLTVLAALAASDAWLARSVYLLLKATAARACASVARAGGRR